MVAVAATSPHRDAVLRRATSLFFRCASAILAACTLVTPSLAAERAAGSLLIYTDDDNNEVIRPTVAGSVVAGPVTATAKTSIDFITAASVDLVTAASPRGFSEERKQVDATGDWDLRDGAGVTAGYRLSLEPDFVTHGASVGARRDLLQRHISLQVGYGLSLATVSRRNDTVFSASRRQHDANISLTRILTVDTAADFAYALTFVDGFQHSPYRFVRLYDLAGGPHVTAVTEHAPDKRLRHSAVARLRTRITRSLFGQLGYRLYVDSWGMTAHTVTGRAIFGITADLTLTAEVRGHIQDAVSFYRVKYTTFPSAPALRTADKELGPMWTALGGLHLDWAAITTAASTLRVGLGADVLHMRFTDYLFLSARTATMVTVDVGWEL